MDERQMLQEQLSAQEQGKSYVLVTILEAEGSSPRSSGKMLVYEDGSIRGTVGGGSVERMAVCDALVCLKKGENLIRTYDMESPASETGMICGGRVTLWLEVHRAKPLLVICGAGHVGGAVLPLARNLGFETLLLDERAPELIQDKILLADRFEPVQDYEKDLEQMELPLGAFYVVVTFGHRGDAEALKAVLRKQGAYVGMIGSRKKVQAVYRRLREEGVSEEELQAVYSPIGLDLGGETPEEIAVSILSEILTVKYGRTGKHMRDWGEADS